MLESDPQPNACDNARLAILMGEVREERHELKHGPHSHAAEQESSPLALATLQQVGQELQGLHAGTPAR
eukprot:2406151-Lingulodinium_polyedra.AAC.1